MQAPILTADNNGEIFRTPPGIGFAIVPSGASPGELRGLTVKSSSGRSWEVWSSHVFGVDEGFAYLEISGATPGGTYQVVILEGRYEWFGAPAGRSHVWARAEGVNANGDDAGGGPDELPGGDPDDETDGLAVRANQIGWTFYFDGALLGSAPPAGTTVEIWEYPSADEAPDGMSRQWRSTGEVIAIDTEQVLSRAVYSRGGRIYLKCNAENVFAYAYRTIELG